MNLILNFKTKKRRKLKPSRKPYICGIRGLRVEKEVKNLGPVLEERPFVIFRVFLTLQCKEIVKENVSRSNFWFINS